MPVLAVNRRANFDYHILENYQAGLSLDGQIVKMIRAGKVTLNGCYVVNNRGILNLINLSYTNALGKTINATVPLLLKTKEVDEIIQQITQKGISCVPLRLKTVGRWIKVDIGVVKGKKNYDKRESIKKRDLDREMRRKF
ncbi:MAG: SsrA-binding protein [Patescibacteria group bacterium]